MSWQSSISTLTARYGKLAQKVVVLVAKRLVLGAGLVVDLHESGFQVVKTVAKDQQKTVLLAKKYINIQDFEHFSKLIGRLTGDMAKVGAKAEILIEKDLTGRIQGVVVRALQEDSALRLAQRKMEQVCRQIFRIEVQNSHLIKGMEDMQFLVGRIGGEAHYAGHSCHRC